MNFLSRFTNNAEPSPAIANDDVPSRRRTFSAAQFRDEELARAAEARAVVEAAEAASAAAAEAARAARLAEAEEQEEELVLDRPAAPPLEWEETVGWLSTRSAEARSLIAQHWNWEHDLRVLQFLVSQPDMDMGVATGIFWLTGATDDFFPWGDDETPEDPQFQRAAAMVQQLGRRFASEDFQSNRFGFDDSWDCSQLKERLEELYLDGRIEWSPASVPTVSPGGTLSLDDVPDGERREVADFLARYGD